MLLPSLGAPVVGDIRGAQYVIPPLVEEPDLPPIYVTQSEIDHRS